MPSNLAWHMTRTLLGTRLKRLLLTFGRHA